MIVRRNGPPRIGLSLARRLARSDDRETIEGDLIESWQRRRAAGRRDLRRAFWRDVLSLRLMHGLVEPRREGGRIGVIHMWRDFRHAFRLFGRQPAFALLVFVTLSLGIGAATTVFTIADRVLLRPLPYPQPHQLVWLDNVGFSFANDRMQVSRAITECPAFSSVGMYVTGGLNLGDERQPARLRAAGVTASFFTVLGTPPAAGRTFTAEEDRDVAKVAVISHDAWIRQFGGAASLIGRDVRLNGAPFTVIGIMPAGFRFPENTDVWILPVADRQIAGSAFSPSIIARLSRGTTLPQAADALKRIDAERRAKRPDYTPVVMEPLQRRLTGAARPTVLLLAGVVMLLLFTTAANVAGLLLTRMLGRQREMIVRAALGASRGRLMTQVGIESLALTVVAGVAGIALATWAIRLFSEAAPQFAPDVSLTAVDARFVLVSVLVMLATSLLFAAGPAFAASRVPGTMALGGTRVTVSTSRWLRHGLVIAQVAMALVLLTVSSAAFAVAIKYARVDIGFHNAGAMVSEVTLPGIRYATNASIAEVLDTLTSRLETLPNVRGVGASSLAPASTALALGVRLQAMGQPLQESGAGKSATMLSSTPGYFQAMGVPLLAGRTFERSDRPGSPPVAVISESAARLLWGDPRAAIGQHLDTHWMGKDHFQPEIVGVVGDVRLRGVKGENSPQVYLPVSQQPPYGSASLVIDAAVDPALVWPAVRDAMRAIDPDLPPYNVTFIRDLPSRFLATERLTLWLTTSFSAVALILSAIGLYGVLSQLVAQRTREIGIRLALGANAHRVRRDVVTSGLRVSAIGVGVGLVAAMLVSRAIVAIVPGLTRPSLQVLSAEAVVMLAVAVLAAWIPARRASAIDPVITLRSE